MTRDERKMAVAAFKERKPVPGIYAVHCTATGQRWLGRVPNLDGVENRIWFTLRQGGALCATLQAAWRQRGAAAFVFEVVERLDPEALPYIRDRILKERLAHWRTALGAESI